MLLIKGKTHDIYIKGDRIIDITEKTSETEEGQGGLGTPKSPRLKMTVLDATKLIVAPGLVDMHVHFREPGFKYKEDIQTGAAAAVAGGFTTCCCMPNTLPVADCEKIIKMITGKALQTPICVLPIGAVTIGQKGERLTNFAALKRAGVVALSDDGMPIIDDVVMRKALIKAAKNDMLLISHCEREGPMVARDIRLAAETDTRVHIAHVSTAVAVRAIRSAKKKGVNVTAEVAPHHFSLTRDMVSTKDTNAKMSPPLRRQKDVDAIIEGLSDGTIDAIATDHAPHSIEEKTLPFYRAPNGIIGLETSLAVTLTFLYHTGKLTMEKIISLMSTNPAKLLNLDAGRLKIGSIADLVIFDPNEEWTVDPTLFKSKSRNTPYDGMKLKGKVKYTISHGKIIYKGGGYA